MATQIITVLCEGPHDVAFICRILKAIGFVSDESTKLGKYPPPMNALLQNEAKKVDVQDLNLTELRRTILPSNVLRKSNEIIFLYSLGGDGKIEDRKKILKDFRSFIPNDGEILTERLPTDTSLALVYFFDADNRGVNQRISDVNNEVQSALTEVEGNLFQNNADVKIVSQIKLGCYIFSEDGNIGKLEDILIPLMKENNETIFDDAEKYLHTHFEDTRLFPLKIKLISGSVEETRTTKIGDKIKYDKAKSLLGTVGQLQSSGKSNIVCISDLDYITQNKILANTHCNAIIDFFTKLIAAPNAVL